jgi:hypothetical protein
MAVNVFVVSALLSGAIFEVATKVAVPFAEPIVPEMNGYMPPSENVYLAPTIIGIYSTVVVTFEVKRPILFSWISLNE